jgi:hypothetical protein
VHKVMYAEEPLRDDPGNTNRNQQKSHEALHLSAIQIVDLA